MDVFVTGGSGQVGPAVVTELVAAGHRVTGLARSDRAAARLAGLGAAVHRGSLEDPESLAAGAKAADGVVHLAIGGAHSDPEALARGDVAAVEALGRALAGSGRPLVGTSGTLVMPAGRVVTERDAPDPDAVAAARIPGERTCLGFAERGVRASVVRLAPTVHGPGDYGFVPVLVAAAARGGVSGYLGDGENRWPAVHRADAARLFRLALESAPAGTALHGVGEPEVPIGRVAQTIGDVLGVPTRSMTVEQAAEHLGNPFLARLFALDAPASSEGTRALLGWSPTGPTLLDDLGDAGYFTPEAIARTEEVWSGEGH